jgi:hypothetical protein
VDAPALRNCPVARTGVHDEARVDSEPSAPGGWTVTRNGSCAPPPAPPGCRVSANALGVAHRKKARHVLVSAGGSIFLPSTLQSAGTGWGVRFAQFDQLL